MTQATEESTTSTAADTGSRTTADLTGPIEAVLLCADRPVPAAKLATAIGLIGEGQAFPPECQEDLASAIDRLNTEYEESDRAFRIETIAGGYRLMTLPKFARCIAAFQQQKVQNRLSKPAVETLAIVAYRQPVTRAEIESIRGVSCGEVLKTLMDHRLVTIQGRAEELGRPILYGTTRQFLDTFGLATIKDLPPVGEIGARS
jgi:segregation and condensation protein B